MWLLYASLAAFFFAVVHVLDHFCVGEIFEKPWLGMVTSSFASIVAFQLIPIIGPFVSWNLPSFEVIIMAFSAGILIQLSQMFYFQALSYSQAGIVAAYWNIIPAGLPIVGFFILGQVLEMREIIGISILVLCSIIMCLLDTKTKARWRALLLMLVASTMQIIAYLLEDIVFDHSELFVSFLIITTGLIVTGFTPLLFRNTRKLIIRDYKKLASLAKFFIVIEIANLVALFFAQLSISQTYSSLVAAVETTMPAYAFLLTAIITLLLPKMGDKSVWNNLLLKIVTIIIMTGGVILVS